MEAVMADIERETDGPLAANIVHETIDNETVIINLETGSYFSLEGPSAVAWQSLVEGEDVARTTDRIADDAGVDRTAVRAALLRLHEDLYAAGILREAPAAATTTDGEMFTLPPMRRYDDMREHLLVDPIHEVERSEGWPAPNQP
jgi:coenzyme PQQ synthesis protein D (PqqD)